MATALRDWLERSQHSQVRAVIYPVAPRRCLEYVAEITTWNAKTEREPEPQ